MAQRQPNPEFSLNGVNGLQQGTTNQKVYWGTKEVSVETVLIKGIDSVYGAVSTGIPQAGLRLYVNANDNSSYPGTGTTWFDLSAEGQDLTVPTAAYTASAGSVPAHFDFTFDYDQGAAYEPGGNLTSVTTQGDQYTVCVFGPYKNSTGGYRTVFRDVENSTNTDQDYVLVDVNTNNLGTYDTTFHGFGVDISSVIPDYTTAFNYQVFTQDGSDVSFYLNDVSGSATGSNTSPLRFDGPGTFGAAVNGNNPGMKLSAVLVYDRVLSGEEIGTIYDYLSEEMGL